MTLHNALIKSRRGQTLIIAIMVMFILALVAAVFISLVARNLSRSERMSNSDAVASIAEAGIRYADEALTTSEEGADWRPIPNNLAPTDKTTDPDFEWLRPYSATDTGDTGPTGGYTRFDCGQGRFLLRLSYNPDPNVPMSRYIKIESIGRWGTIIDDDPTTKHSGLRMRREITAFKPIGITDYSRFITNKDNRSVDVALGVPGYDVDFGRGTASRYGVRGGPIRVNANLLWYGNYGGGPSVNIYLRGVPARDTAGASADFMPIDGVEVAGDIKTDSDPSNDATKVNVKLHALIRDSSGFTDNPFSMLPSSDDHFTTAYGFYRDGSNLTAYPPQETSSKPGYEPKWPRGVKRIEPPMVDQADPTNTTTRYRVLTLNSGQRVRSGGRRPVNTGALGWGKGVYINNPNDKQDESETITGGYTVRGDIMQPGNISSPYWKGPYYLPPAATITLVPDDKETVKVDGKDQTQYYFTITRSDASTSQSAMWSDASGAPRPDWGGTVRMPYPSEQIGRTFTPREMGSNNTEHIDSNGVIFAEGNIRVRGMLPPGMKLTIVSNQNIYIDGSVLKYRDPAATISATDPYHGADPTCGLALLARQNVIVNTTQFFAPLNNIGADDYGTDSLAGASSSHVVVRNDPNSRLRCQFEFAPYESETNATPSAWDLFIRHAGEYGPAYINAWLNPTDTALNWGILDLNTVYNQMPKHIFGVGDPNFAGGTGQPGAGSGSSFIYNVFTLPSLAANPLLITTPGIPNLLQIALDQVGYTRSNYWMGGLAVMPMDVRIEAIIYAQEGSFFVIPGYWLNPNRSDNQTAYTDNGSHRPPGVDERFPFYGQAPDIRIVVDGAVSENLPASVSDVEEWMAKWGRIPAKYGSSTTATAHAQEGLTFLYDDHIGWPLDDSTTPQPVRKDAYGRALPLTPRLPVSTSLVYFGDVM